MPKNATEDEALAEEIRSMEAELAALESERAEIAAAEPPSWDDLQRAGALDELAAQEHRRAYLPRLINAARAKLVELRIRREQALLGPLRVEQEAAYAVVVEATAKAREAEEERVAALHRWREAHGEIEDREQRIKRANRELAELRAGRG